MTESYNTSGTTNIPVRNDNVQKQLNQAKQSYKNKWGNYLKKISNPRAISPRTYEIIRWKLQIMGIIDAKYKQQIIERDKL